MPKEPEKPNVGVPQSFLQSSVECSSFWEANKFDAWYFGFSSDASEHTTHTHTPTGRLTDCALLDGSKKMA